MEIISENGARSWTIAIDKCCYTFSSTSRLDDLIVKRLTSQSHLKPRAHSFARRKIEMSTIRMLLILLANLSCGQRKCNKRRFITIVTLVYVSSVRFIHLINVRYLLRERGRKNSSQHFERGS